MAQDNKPLLDATHGTVFPLVFVEPARQLLVTLVCGCMFLSLSGFLVVSTFPISVCFIKRRFAGMAGTLSGLFVTHRKQRDREREKRVQYWREQVSTISNCIDKI